MYRRLSAALPHRRSRAARGLAVTVVSAVLATLCLLPTSSATQNSATFQSDESPAAAQEQVLTWTADDSTTEYASAPTTATAGPATLVFENSTDTGNTTGMPHTLTFDTSNPDYNQDVDVDILASPSDSNGGRYEVDVVLSPGEYRYFCDIPGHGQMEGVLVVTDDGGEDTTPPDVSAEVSGDQNDDGDYVGAATVTLAATDTDSGVDTVEYQIDDMGFEPYTEPVTVDEPGDHSVQYRATDNAGNTSDTGTVSFTVVEPDPGDTTPPDVSADVSGDQNSDGDYVGAATVTLTATDTDSGIDTIEYNLDNAGFEPYTDPITIDEPGDHTVEYRATDNAGNTSDVKSVIVTIVEPDPGDTTPPDVSAEVSGDQNDDGDYVGAATVTLTATDTDSGIDTIEYNLDNAGFEPYTDPITIDEPGDHTVEYRATDNAGNTSDVKSVIVTIVEPDPGDTTPPDVSAEVSGDQNSDGDYVGSATVTLTATDTDSGIDTIEYDLDSTGFEPYTDPVTVDEPGDHTVEYRATDNAGNTSDVKSVIVTIVEPDPGECSDTRDTVIIGSIDTTVENADVGDGCTINDLIDEDGEYANHGQFVKHVRDVTKELMKEGIVSGSEKGRIMSAAARSDIGK
ncbi:OmpL47-type beta-barrel domain-containing protein [Phytoactinopolyspora halophila]|uniref:Copper-binding protein n=1 Tax=Phytoactinopolyspora halophila TaxID=1981511 RepID=A0A329R0B4_9ACTN|nr:plastocyanin/azurin family copper-binding protein [Phytoactinopolyspora halophila]RAW17596.1 copper-binding protein [Phytoactinopolyspora halophila]